MFSSRFSAWFCNDRLGMEVSQQRSDKNRRDLPSCFFKKILHSFQCQTAKTSKGMNKQIQ